MGYAHEHSNVHDPAARRLVQHCLPALRSAQARRAYARKRSARRHVMLHARGALRLNEILEHASPVLGSGLSKIGRAGDSGIVTPSQDRGRSGAWGAGRWSAPLSARGRSAARGAGRWSAPLSASANLAGGGGSRARQTTRRRPSKCTWQLRRTRSGGASPLWTHKLNPLSKLKFFFMPAPANAHARARTRLRLCQCPIGGASAKQVSVRPRARWGRDLRRRLPMASRASAAVASSGRGLQANFRGKVQPVKAGGRASIGNPALLLARARRALTGLRARHRSRLAGAG